MVRQAKALRVVFSLLWMPCIALCFCAPAVAMDGVFDRDAEVRSYVHVVETGSRKEFLEAARKIYMSGIGDERLARALQTRLQNEFRTLGAPKSYRAKTLSLVVVEDRYIDETDINYGKWLLNASCSTGAEFLASTYAEIADRGGSRLKEMRVFAAFSAQHLSWHRRKNELMASRQYHHVGDDPQVSRLVNLLYAEDLSYRDFAYDYIRVNGLREPRYFEVVGANLLASISQPITDRNRKRQATTEIRLLGDSNDRNNAAILRRVADSNVEGAIKTEARNALSRLQ